jgi:hypothetical protein
MIGAVGLHAVYVATDCGARGPNCSELAERFDSSHVKIVTALADRSLVRPDGRPDARAYSDHLPVIFELEF